MSRHHTDLNVRRWSAVRRLMFECDGWRCTRVRPGGPPRSARDKAITSGFFGWPGPWLRWRSTRRLGRLPLAGR